MLQRGPDSASCNPLWLLIYRWHFQDLSVIFLALERLLDVWNDRIMVPEFNCVQNRGCNTSLLSRSAKDCLLSGRRAGLSSPHAMGLAAAEHSIDPAAPACLCIRIQRVNLGDGSASVKARIDPMLFRRRGVASRMPEGAMVSGHPGKIQNGDA